MYTCSATSKRYGQPSGSILSMKNIDEDGMKSLVVDQATVHPNLANIVKKQYDLDKNNMHASRTRRDTQQAEDKSRFIEKVKFEFPFIK